MSAIQSFFTSQALCLRDGRIAAMAQHYALPLPVFLPGRVPRRVLLRHRAQVEQALRWKFDGLAQLGIHYLRAAVTQEKNGGGGRCTAAVDWFYVDGGGARRGRTSADYYLSRRPCGLEVQMISFERLALDAVGDWFEAAEQLERPFVLQ